MDRWQHIRALWARQDALRCPVCALSLRPEGRGLVCAKGHRFDLARQGHADLSRGAGAKGGQYGAALWRARRDVADSGFFAPLIEAVRELLPSDGGLCADAGCGEGSLTAALAHGSPQLWFGLDLSREGVKMAAAAFRDCLWAVADLSAMPLADASASAVVNLLSPAAYREFFRVLKRGGTLIKAFPDKEHLKELRAWWNIPPPEAEAERNFASHFQTIKRLSVRHTVTADALLPALAAMSPLGTGRDTDSLPSRMEVTLSVTVCAANT